MSPVAAIRSMTMANPHLTAVSNDAKDTPTAGEVYSLARGAETGAQRLRRMQQEMRLLAREQVEALARDFDVLAQRAAEIADGGEAFPVGVRELTSRLAADLPQKAQSLMSIMGRAG
jgi:hypothetical protein